MLFVGVPTVYSDSDYTEEVWRSSDSEGNSSRETETVDDWDDQKTEHNLESFQRDSPMGKKLVTEAAIY